MKMTTLCYLERGDEYLMLHRIKKKNDENHDKWIGVGGKFEANESPEDCMRREIFEETGLKPNSLSYRGIVTFVSDIYGTEYMHLFSTSDFSGKINKSCSEGELVWVEKSKIPSLNIWEGDKIFLCLLETEKRFFSLKLCYKGDKLVQHKTEFK
jgi:8-oxo-dGTP diphosphatase